VEAYEPASRSACVALAATPAEREAIGQLIDALAACKIELTFTRWRLASGPTRLHAVAVAVDGRPDTLRTMCGHQPRHSNGAEHKDFCTSCLTKLERIVITFNEEGKVAASTARTAIRAINTLETRPPDQPSEQDAKEIADIRAVIDAAIPGAITLEEWTSAAAMLHLAARDHTATPPAAETICSGRGEVRDGGPEPIRACSQCHAAATELLARLSPGDQLRIVALTEEQIRAAHDDLANGDASLEALAERLGWPTATLRSRFERFRLKTTRTPKARRRSREGLKAVKAERALRSLRRAAALLDPGQALTRAAYEQLTIEHDELDSMVFLHEAFPGTDWYEKIRLAGVVDEELARQQREREAEKAERLTATLRAHREAWEGVSVKSAAGTADVAAPGLLARFRAAGLPRPDGREMDWPTMMRRFTLEALRDASKRRSKLTELTYERARRHAPDLWPSAPAALAILEVDAFEDAVALGEQLATAA
jgi:hypothetical protein